MLGLFRQQAKYEAVEVEPDTYLMRFRTGRWPFYVWEYAIFDDGKMIAADLSNAKTFFRGIDMYYYEDFQIIKL